MNRHYLDSVFEPRSVAVIASFEGKADPGSQVLRNLLRDGFEGSIYPVNEEHQETEGLACYPALSAIDKSLDLVLIAVPATRVPALVQECGECKVGAVVVLSGGFAETGQRGLALQDEIVDVARSYGIPLVGPNCMGVVRPQRKFNACAAPSPVRKGQVALVTQSGAFATALLDWADANGFGFSAVASLGSTSDVRIGDVLDYLGTDPQTRSILLNVENIPDARTFLSGLRVAARLKPVVVIKSGRHPVTSRASTLLEGRSAGDDGVFDAAIRRAGAVRVLVVNQLFAAARILASGVRVQGSRLAVITNGGGPGVMAADWAGDVGVPLAELTPTTVEQLQQLLPAHWSQANPVDILGDAGPERYQKATELLLADKNVDGLLVLLTPQAATDAVACAEAVVAGRKGSSKPVLTSWMGARLVDEGREVLAAAGIPQLPAPEAGVDAFGYLASYRRNQNALLQVPEPLGPQADPDSYGARLIIDHALSERRQGLGNAESKAILRAFRIPVLNSLPAASAADALVAAENVGLPVAMKVNSPDIEHKAEVGGVRLNVRESRSVHAAFDGMLEEVRRRCPEARIDGVNIEPMVERPHAREIRIGIHQDPVFGPVISLGTAGQAEEVLADCQVALPPLNDFLSRELIGRTRASRFLQGFRGFPEADIDRLVEVLQRVSEIACELPAVRELEINPLLVDEEGVIAVDARIQLAQPQVSTARYGHMAIHPYPADLEERWRLADDSELLVRPIRPEDGRIEADFVANLSPQSKYFRFMGSLDKLTPLMLARFTQIDYDREMALVAVQSEAPGDDHILAVARYVSNPDRMSCEFALTVADEWQKRGIGRQMMERLMQVARDRGLEEMYGEVLAENSKMLRLCRKLGFHSRRNPEAPEIILVRRRL